MNYLQHRMNIFSHSCALIFILLGYNTSAQAAELRISTDIAPIHSLVSLVVGKLMPVELIVPPNQSPHDFTLKPSQIRTINQSDLIVIVSAGFSPSLSRHLNVLNSNTVLLNLADTHSKDVPTHNETEQNHATHDDAHTDSHRLEDEHTWLNPSTVVVWVEHIVQSIAKLDEPNRATYRQNADKAIADIKQMHESISIRLQPVRTAPYIVYHDAYQHFANAFNLSDPVPIALSDARAPGAAKLKQIRNVAQHSRCVFAEVQHDDAIVDTVSSGLPVKRGILDPLGSTIPIGPKLYSELMHELAISFLECLSE